MRLGDGVKGSKSCNQEGRTEDAKRKDDYADVRI